MPVSPAQSQTVEVDLTLGENSVVRLRVAPWGTVRVNGKILGLTPPMAEVKLSAGTHSLEVSNGRADPLRRVLNLRAGEITTVSYDFEGR